MYSEHFQIGNPVLIFPFVKPTTMVMENILRVTPRDPEHITMHHGRCHHPYSVPDPFLPSVPDEERLTMGGMGLCDISRGV